MATKEKMKESNLLIARHVIDQEIVGLKALGDNLGKEFDDVIDTLLDVKGRVIVSGMGKSGHVGRKIAATLSSTGTPAFFVHPAEASHGDLGMVTSRDVLLLMSTSGETKELSDLTAFSKRFDIPLIGITQRKGSALDKAADISLILPQVQEACPMGLAPTTSSTMMLALGDAIAVALLSKRSFTQQDFHRLHPGGKLGQRLLTVGKIMHALDDMPLVQQGASMKEAIDVMTDKCLGCVGVMGEKGKLLGVITDGDLRRNLDKNILDLEVDDIMNKTPKTIEKGALAVEAVRVLNENGITCLFVLENEEVVGILHIHDCLRMGIA